MSGSGHRQTPRDVKRTAHEEKQLQGKPIKV